MKYAALIKKAISVNRGTLSGPGIHEEFSRMIKFATKEEMEDWVKTTRYPNYTLIQYNELKVETTIVIKDNV